MRQSSERSLAAVGRQLRWFMWSLGAPLDPRWATDWGADARSSRNGRVR
jgi:hypothetical protein